MDDEHTFCGGNASPSDTHLLSTVHCKDGEIVEWLEKRERRKAKKASSRLINLFLAAQEVPKATA